LNTILSFFLFTCVPFDANSNELNFTKDFWFKCVFKVAVGGALQSDGAHRIMIPAVTKGAARKSLRRAAHGDVLFIFHAQYTATASKAHAESHCVRICVIFLFLPQ
jgi:hypothetical protein